MSNEDDTSSLGEARGEDGTEPKEEREDNRQSSEVVESTQIPLHLLGQGYPIVGSPMAPSGLQVASLQFSSQLLPIPIPSPEVLKKYAEIDPNLPKQIVDEALEQVEFTRQLTQKQMQHRHELEKWSWNRASEDRDGG